MEWWFIRVSFRAGCEWGQAENHIPYRTTRIITLPAKLAPKNQGLVFCAHAHRSVSPSVDLRVQVGNWPCYADTACLSYSEGSPRETGRIFALEKRFSLDREETGENQCWGYDTAIVPSHVRNAEWHGPMEWKALIGVSG